jgi:hypothetical protein
MEKQVLLAILGEDLKNFLESTNEMDKITNGDIHCKECHCLMSIENLQLIIPHKNDAYEYICNSVQCIMNYKTKLEEI